MKVNTRKATINAILSIITLIMLSPLQGFALLQWESIGPFGGDQFIVQISPNDPNTLFSFGHHNIHRSTDAGLSWDPIHTTEMSKGSFRALTFEPTDANHLFVSGSRIGVWYSPDQGASWQQRSNGLPTTLNGNIYPVISLAFNANGSLFAGLGVPGPLDIPPAWIYRSDDGGNSWIPDDNGIQITVAGLNQKAKVLLSTNANGQLWAMAHGAGVYVYSNGAWLSRNGNLPVEALRGTYLEHDLQDGNHLLLGTEDSWVYETKNGGQSWVSMPLPQSLAGLQTLPLVYTIALDPNNAQIMWVAANDASGSNEQPLFKPLPQQTSGKGGYLSFDGGAQWVKKQTGSAFHITIDPRETIENDFPPYGLVRRSRIWYIAGGGYSSLQKSDDGAVTFQKITDGINAILINTVWNHPSPPTADKKLFAAAESGLYQHDDTAGTWDRQKAAQNTLYTWSFAADPLDPNTIYYSTGNPAWSFTGQRGIYRLTLDCFGPRCPQGEQILQNVGVWRVITSPLQPQTIYAATQEEGIRVSYDRGQTWSTLNSGLVLPQSITDIELDQSGLPLYAAARSSNGNLTANPPQPWQAFSNEDGRIYRFDSGTGQWSELPGMTFATLDLEISPQDPNTLFAATVRGVYKTSDNGASWQSVLPNVITYDLVLDPGNPNYLYAATSNGVLRSTDGGTQWHDLVSADLPSRVYSLALDPQTGILYVATGGNSVYKLIPDPNPQPVISIQPATLDVGIVPLGFSKTSDAILTNNGEANLVITNVVFGDPSFSIDNLSLPITVTPGSNATLAVRFTPGSLGVVQSVIVFSSNDPNTPALNYSAQGEGGQAVTPILSIQANGQTGSLTVSKGQVVKITIKVAAGDFEGQLAEWWANAVTPFGTYWAINGASWRPSETPLLGMQGPITSITTPYTILKRTLPKGQYVVKFVLDDFVNALLDEVWVDTVTVTVQ